MSLISILQFLAYAFIFFVGAIFLAIIVTYIVDKTQTKQTIRRNYPVIGHFRYFFEHVGTFLRQYFFAMDREELPFNRAERSWVYRAAKNIDSTVAFGSTRNIYQTGTVFFANSMYPSLANDNEDISVTFGPQTKNPFSTNSFFNISAMSYGALSTPAVRALSHGAKKAGIWLNTGEGGVSPFHLESGCAVIFQIGTAKFGVRDKAGNLCPERLKEVASKEQIKMFEIKLSQGAKAGKGGILPGAKVNEEIAGIRGIEIGQDAISPNRHPEIESGADLLKMINQVRDISEKPVGIKFCAGDFGEFEELCQLIKNTGAEQAPDFITIDGSSGGTGAAPQSLIDNVGLPLRESLPRVIDLLEQYGLRERIKVISSAKLITPAEVAWAMAIGADAVNNARGFMFSLGCIQALQCNKNTCPTGITTHNKKLQKGLDPTNKAERVAHYAKNMMKEVNIIANSCGVTHARKLERKHLRIVNDHGHSQGFTEFYKDAV